MGGGDCGPSPGRACTDSGATSPADNTAAARTRRTTARPRRPNSPTPLRHNPLIVSADAGRPNQSAPNRPITDKALRRAGPGAQARCLAQSGRSVSGCSTGAADGSGITSIPPGAAGEMVSPPLCCTTRIAAAAHSAAIIRRWVPGRAVVNDDRCIAGPDRGGGGRAGSNQVFWRMVPAGGRVRWLSRGILRVFRRCRPGLCPSGRAGRGCGPSTLPGRLL